MLWRISPPSERTRNTHRRTWRMRRSTRSRLDQPTLSIKSFLLGLSLSPLQGQAACCVHRIRVAPVLCSGVNPVWHLGGRWSGLKKFDFSRQISEKFRLSQVISHEKSIFQANLTKIFDFFQVISPKHFDSSREIYEKFRFLWKISQKFVFPGKIGHLQLLLGK